MKDLTTGDVARICRVSPRTAQLWFDRGMIVGAYTVPGSRHRRVPREALVRFMESHSLNVPVDLLNGDMVPGRAFSSEA